jgi:hypothetical protein
MMAASQYQGTAPQFQTMMAASQYQTAAPQSQAMMAAPQSQGTAPQPQIMLAAPQHQTMMAASQPQTMMAASQSQGTAPQPQAMMAASQPQDANLAHATDQIQQQLAAAERRGRQDANLAHATNQIQRQLKKLQKTVATKEETQDYPFWVHPCLWLLLFLGFGAYWAMSPTLVTSVIFGFLCLAEAMTLYYYCRR